MPGAQINKENRRGRARAGVRVRAGGRAGACACVRAWVGGRTWAGVRGRAGAQIKKDKKRAALVAQSGPVGGVYFLPASSSMRMPMAASKCCNAGATALPVALTSISRTASR